jgi:hypothetical protein
LAFLPNGSALSIPVRPADLPLAFEPRGVNRGGSGRDAGRWDDRAKRAVLPGRPERPGREAVRDAGVDERGIRAFPFGGESDGYPGFT